MRITAAQINPVVGAIDDNTDRVLAIARDAFEAGANLAVFSELVITGYPPKDLLERPSFVRQTDAAVDRVVAESKRFGKMGIIVGVPRRTHDDEGKALYNSAVLISAGEIVFEQPKILLPTYDVFDEARYFKAGTDNDVVEFGGVRLGLSVCEDLWFEPDPWNRRPYACDPIEMLAGKGCDLLVNISASPFSVDKEKVRFELIRNHCKRYEVPFLFVNQVGGNDDLVFDGRSLFVGGDGRARVVLPSFEERVEAIDTESKQKSSPYEYEDEVDAVYRALVLGTRDYVNKCGFKEVIIGLSGGVDSAVTAVIARDAVGAENVHALAMPSPYSSQGSLDDARALASNLGVAFDVIPIADLMASYEAALARAFEGRETDATEENIQARIRGNIIMAHANKFGYLPLSTGNKSELSVGYCTLYGDMSGGLGVVSDVPKTLVYRLARHANRDGEVIPRAIIDKVPSAELRPDQTDQDTLPPYDVLDGILERYVDRHQSRAEIVAAGFEPEVVEWVVRAVQRNEYKRRQAAPGIKVTSKAFGTGRRFPIAARYDA